MVARQQHWRDRQATGFGVQQFGSAVVRAFEQTVRKAVLLMRLRVAQHAVLQPRDGTKLTAMMKERVTRHRREGGDLYLLADATDMTRAKNALKDYGLAIRWPECQQFDTNITGTYQWCPLARLS